MKAIDRVMKFLTDKGLKPSHVEQQLHLSNGYLGKMQKRNADIGERNLLKLSEFLGFSLTFLISGIEEDDSNQVLLSPKEIIELQKEVIRLQKENAALKENKSHKHPAFRTVSGQLKNEP